MKHIILIGFKHTGKSVIGKSLAGILNKPFLDLDAVVEEMHLEKTGDQLNCRQIVQAHGIEHLRKLEHTALNLVLAHEAPHIISVGGGTPLHSENRELISQHEVIHVTAPRGIVFERIMVNGKPAFFPENVNTFDAFTQIWNEREPIYTSLAQVEIVNNGSIEEAVKKISHELALHTV
jgi:shikimate kinase